MWERRETANRPKTGRDSHTQQHLSNAACSTSEQVLERSGETAALLKLFLDAHRDRMSQLRRDSSSPGILGSGKRRRSGSAYDDPVKGC